MTERLQTDRNQTTPDDESERLRRWRLVLGKSAESPQNRLDGDYMEMDVALEKIYGDNQKALKRGGLGPSAPRVARAEFTSTATSASVWSITIAPPEGRGTVLE